MKLMAKKLLFIKNYALSLNYKLENVHYGRN